MNKNRYMLLISNTAIFAIGNILVKLMSFFLMPLYTSVLTTEQYGVSELLNSSVEIILPLATLCIVEALYRFSIDKDANSNSLFTNALVIILVGDVIVGVGCVLLKHFNDYQYAFEFAILYIAISSYKLTTQFARGLGHTKRFAFYGVVNAVLLIISNLILLVIMKGDIREYLLSFSIGYGITSIVALFASNELRYVHIGAFDKVSLKAMLKYGIPDIPNTLSWWVNSVLDRYILMYFCGASISGLYTAASKLPAMINLVTSIFQQAWQYSAVKEIDSEDNKSFFANVFRAYTCVCVLLCVILIICNRLICGILLKTDFYSAWRFVPMLLLAATFGCFSSYFGSFYGALKNNVAAMFSTVTGAVVNLILNLVLIPLYGGFGAAVATAISYGTISLIRFFDLKKRINIVLNYPRIIMQLVILVLLTVLSMSDYYIATYIFGLFAIIIIIFLDFELINNIFKKLIKLKR